MQKFGKLGKVALKRGQEKGGRGRDVGTAGYFGPFACLDVLLLLWRVLLSGIAGGWGCVQLVQ
jgi:hypothetical protein